MKVRHFSVRAAEIKPLLELECHYDRIMLITKVEVLIIMTNLYPMKLEAAYKDYLWGGIRLKEEFGKVTDVDPVAESWEISCHPDGDSMITNGEFEGRSLWSVLSSNTEMMGTKCIDKSQFPVLIKFIDAKDKLSLQVHPDDAYAFREENQQGKNEMWYIVDCVPDAKLILGFKHEHTKEELRSMIENDTMQDHVQFVDISPGDCYCIPAGLLHAICEGVLIAELQQNSNVTYRVYDYGRVGPDGQPRELHIKKALDVTNTSLKPEKSDLGIIKTANYIEEKLADWDYFNAWKLNLFGKIELNAGIESFQTLTCLKGSATLQYDDGSLDLGKGESIFIPAGFGRYILEGDAEFFFVEL